MTTIVEYFGAGKVPHHCGYCNSDGSYSYGMWAHSMECRDYQCLIDRGWRRSGKYCYKPIMEKTCCPAYTIRCEAAQFRFTKKLRRIVNNLEAFLKSDTKPKQCMSVQKPNNDRNVEQNDLHSIAQSSNSVPPYTSVKIGAVSPKRSSPSKARIKRLNMRIEKLMKLQNLSHQEAYNFIITRHKNRLAKYHSRTVSLSNALESCNLNQERHSFDIRMLRSEPPCSEFTNTLDLELSLYRKYQMEVHKDSESELTMQKFRRFLVDSPLVGEQTATQQSDRSYTGQFCGFGSFHRQYWLDGKLIAVAVLDVLPSCVSSVYFFYDPEVSFLQLGKYSVLDEIYLTKLLSEYHNSLRYYYLGFYIHNCTKMRYKGHYRPCDLLCPETYSWHSIESCLKMLDQAKYCRFNRSSNKTTNTEKEEPISVNKTLILHKQERILYGQLLKKRNKKRASNIDDKDEVAEYTQLVGYELAQRMLLYRNS